MRNFSLIGAFAMLASGNDMGVGMSLKSFALDVYRQAYSDPLEERSRSQDRAGEMVRQATKWSAVIRALAVVNVLLWIAVFALAMSTVGCAPTFYAGAGALSRPERDAQVTEGRVQWAHTSNDLYVGTASVGGYVRIRLILAHSGGGVATGSVELLGEDFEIIEGGGAFAIAPGQRRVVRLLFLPSRPGLTSCNVVAGRAVMVLGGDGR